MPLATGGMAQLFLGKTGGIAGFERYVVLKMILADRLGPCDRPARKDEIGRALELAPCGGDQRILAGTAWADDQNQVPRCRRGASSGAARPTPSRSSP